MHKINHLRWKKRFLPLEIMVGIFIVIFICLFNSNMDMLDTQERMDTTLQYVKQQCMKNQMQNLAEEANSLLRVTESIEQVRERLRYDKSGNLESCARDTYLDGLMLLDVDGNLQASWSNKKIPTESILKQVGKDALLDVVGFSEKHYAIRVNLKSGAYVDLAAMGQLDGKGIVLGYYYTSGEYARIFSQSIWAVVTAFEPKRSGILVVSDGKKILASNDTNLVGTKVKQIPILKKMMEQKSGKKLVKALKKGHSFAYQFGVMDQSQEYYIYAFADANMVFPTTFRKVLYASCIYLFILVISHMILWKMEHSYQKNEIQIQKEYMDTLKEKNAELEEAIMQAQKANAAKRSFLSRMSHDIRTPLNGIIGLIKINQAHFNNQKFVMENHEKMMISANHLLSLINDVLQMSKIEDGKIVLHYESMNLWELTKQIKTIIEDRALEVGIHWECKKEENIIPYPYVYGSCLHLRQIFLNIYGNCIKYNRPNGKIKTTVEMLENKDGICTYKWVISDTGIGMSEEFLKNVFEPFAQEKNDARSVYQGTGLGMTIAKGLIDQMGGKILVSSKKDVGSTFTIILPFKLANPPAQLPMEEENGGDIRGLKILMAEDNTLNAEIAKTLFEDRGAKIDLVKNGREAVEQFAENPKGTYDAILMDIMMPIMDGMQATKKIRGLSRPDANEILILAMTANAFEEDAIKCFESGMDFHLTKPLEIEKAVSILSKYCKTKG